MKKALVIGGKGKVGNYLLPMLVQSGYEVTAVTRGNTPYYRDVPELKQVKELHMDRKDPEFLKTIAAGEWDVVVDMLLFYCEDLEKLIDALRDKTGHLVVCGSLWLHGASDLVPVREEDCLTPPDRYGKAKLAMTRLLEREWRENRFPGTIVHPGHICAPGHVIINPQGNVNPQVFEKLRTGQELLLPGDGLATLHHVHAEDVAGIMHAAILAGEISFGESFHAASAQAMSLAGYARHTASLFGQEARLIFAPWEEFARAVGPEDAALTLEHISRSPAASMDKVRRVLNYTPRSAYETVDENILNMQRR